MGKSSVPGGYLFPKGQYRRNWGIVPALWNLYFRECINLKASLHVKEVVASTSPDVSDPRDVAQAAVDIYKALENGTRGHVDIAKP